MEKFLDEFDEYWIDDDNDTIQVGDSVVCINNENIETNNDENILTLDKIYKVVKIKREIIRSYMRKRTVPSINTEELVFDILYVINDIGKKYGYYSSRFKKVYNE